MNYIQIFIKTPSEAELDLNQEMEIALQYSVADIKDITKRNSAHSKTIILPGTKNNNYWFGNLFDINSDFTMFNPNKKVDARILVNTETVIDGFLQLKKIKKLVNTDEQGNMIQYEVVVYNNAVDLMTELGEKTINELDFSKFNHTYSNVNIKDSWNNTYKEGYVYPMYGVENGSSNYKANWFYPATFYRTALDEIIKEAGFGWKGSLKTNAQFNREIIPYVSDNRPKINQSEIDSRLFYVGVTNSTAEYTIPNFPNNYSFSTFLTNYIIPFGKETTPYFDINNHWNPTTSIWTIDKNGDYTTSYNLSFDLILKNTVNTTITRTTTPGPSVKAEFKLEYSVNNGVTWTLWNTASKTIVFTQASISPLGTASQNISINNTTPSINFNIGTKVRLTTTLSRNNSIWWSILPNTTYPAITSKIKLSTTNGGNWIKNNSTSTELSEGDTIQLSQFLSEKIKQKDLITDLIKRYNLYIQTDPDNPRVLIFDTRPDFYSSGTTLDWTNKKDYSSEDQIELLSELQFKKMIFNYKSDSDKYNKDYLDETGDIYGQYKYTFDNDFVKGQENIETPFSPTPLVKTSFGAIVPAINPESPKVNQRILYWGGLKSYGSGWKWTYQNTITGATTSTETFTTYPYAGHFDDPIEPTLDINFGVCKYYWYNELESVTQNNMYNKYWSNYIRQIEEGRMVTSKFYLDEADIRFIKDNFNTKIFVLDSYYYVNKIIDYKPLNNSTTLVELIKVTEGLQWEPIGNKVVVQKPNKSPNFMTGVNIGSGNIGSGGNVVVGSGNISGGSTKTPLGVTKAKTQIIIGDDNTVTGDNSIVSGYKNVVTGDNSSVIGGDNNIITADDTILIGTKNITATEPGIIYIGNSFIVDAITGAVIVVSNYVSASRNEVLNPFPDNKIINYVSASRNEIREIGSVDIINYISGGRYTE